MAEYILSFTDEHADLATVGGKGMSLARMARAGLPVPGGFYLSTAAYREFVKANQLDGNIQQAVAGVSDNQPEACESASEVIKAGFEAGLVPSALEDEILLAYSRMQADQIDISVAVRSSATAEDLPGASFAGQQETYLNIRGGSALLLAVKHCWASLWTARAISYRMKNDIDQTSVALAVVVQRMVFADAAGVLFTANPINGMRRQTLINAAWGLGEAVVSSAVSPDGILVDRTKRKVLSYDVADKTVMTVRTETGTQEQPTPPDMRKKPVLTRAQALLLAELGGRVETLYGAPLDIEWVLVGDDFQIVQARPITTLPPDWPTPVARAIYARGSLAEHLPGPVTPLFATLGLQLANDATNSMWLRVMGRKAKDKLIAGDGFYVPINGFVYGGMFFGPGEILPVLMMSLSQVGPMFHGSVERWRQARVKLEKVVSVWESRDLSQLIPSDLLAGVQAVFGAACVFFTDIQTCLPAASSSEVLFTRFYNSFIKRSGDPDATRLLLGSDTRALQAEKSLFDLTAWVKGHQRLAEKVGSLSTFELLNACVPDGVPPDIWQEWLGRVDQHRMEYGRAAYEFDFAVTTPFEEPGVFVEAIKAYLSGKAADPHQRHQEALSVRREAEEKITRRTIPPFRGWFIRLLHWAQETNPMREDSIQDMGMGHPLVRRMLAELGRRLVSAGGLAEVDQIYWLELRELEPTLRDLEAGRRLPDLTGQIPARKEEWNKQKRLSPPNMLPLRSGWSRMYSGKQSKTVDGKTLLHGHGTSSGVVTATARVLLGPEDFGRLKPGDVLVAVTTTPAWTPLFALASAVVTDIGGPLSHSSIVAREYNIPAVMAARGATRLIRDGQQITVDGLNGTVVLEE
jgi:rifampicin phosphotransferase